MKLEFLQRQLHIIGKVWSRNADQCVGRLRLKCDGTRAETRFRLSAKRTSPLEASVQSTTGSRGVRISGSNAGYTMFRRSVKSTSYPLHSPVSSSLPLPCVTVCHHVLTGLYQWLFTQTDFQISLSTGLRIINCTNNPRVTCEPSWLYSG